MVPLWAAACSIASASWGGKETDRFTRRAIGSQGSTSGRTGSVGRPPPHAGRQQAVSGRQNKQSARQLWQTTIMCFTGQTHNSPSDLAYWGRRTKTSNPRVGGSSPSGRAESAPVRAHIFGGSTVQYGLFYQSDARSHPCCAFSCVGPGLRPIVSDGFDAKLRIHRLRNAADVVRV